MTTGYTIAYGKEFWDTFSNVIANIAFVLIVYGFCIRMIRGFKGFG